MNTNSDVFFTTMRTLPGSKGLTGKLDNLLAKAGFDTIDFKDKFVAIKIHFGEKGNLAFLRPNYARTVADRIKSLGGKPFLTDCSTLYSGSRKDALEHLETAWLNGFTPYTVGCPILIADGLKGTDDVEVPIKNGILLNTAFIGRAVMDADIVISLNHFKGHEMCGVGGAIKNLGMGCGSKLGKKIQHADGRVSVNTPTCIGCGACSDICAHEAPVILDGKCSIDENKCLGCGRCIKVCPTHAISTTDNYSTAVFLDRKMAEYAKAVIQDKPSFHINIATDISPYCDCHAENDAPIVPNIGFFASFDPIAVDQASVDAVNSAPVNHNSVLGENIAKDGDHFTKVSPSSNWSEQLAHGEKLGLGTRNYHLIKLD